MESLINFANMDNPEFFIRLLLAAFLGAIIGLERDIHGRAAGLRTHLLVSLGSALFMVISIDVIEYVSLPADSLAARPDPGRIAAQVVTGIGFIGGGAILKDGVFIRGLTTAACLWLTAAIGMSCGAGYYHYAIFSTGIALLTLIWLNKFERIYKKDLYRFMTIKTPVTVAIEDIVNAIEKKGAIVLHCDFSKDFDKNELRAKVSLKMFHRGLTFKRSREIMDGLEEAKIPLKSASWHH